MDDAKGRKKDFLCYDILFALTMDEGPPLSSANMSWRDGIQINTGYIFIAFSWKLDGKRRKGSQDR